LRPVIEKTNLDLFSKAESLTSNEDLHWVLIVRNIDVREWELHLRVPSGTAVKPKYLSHIDSFAEFPLHGPRW